MILSRNDQQLLRLSVVVWLATAIVSVWELQGQSAQLQFIFIDRVSCRKF